MSILWSDNGKSYERKVPHPGRAFFAWLFVIVLGLALSAWAFFDWILRSVGL